MLQANEEKLEFDRSNQLQAHELTREQFFSQVSAKRLTNLGWRWSVALPGRYVHHSNAPTAEGAISEAHRVAVMTALQLNIEGIPGIEKPSMPPSAVLAEYPDMA